MEYQTCTIREEEYRYLIEDHEKNRAYMFERPLIILGIIIASTQYLLSSILSKSGPELESVQDLQLIPSIVILPAFIGILYFNLYFTSQRLRSDARIVAYIQLFHENELSNHWVGWETSLRYYRLYDFDPEKNQDKFNAKSAKKRKHQKGFYPLIFWFHLIFMIFIFFVWIFVVWIFGTGIFHTSSLLFMLFIFVIAFLMFLSKCLKRLSYSNFMNLLENERNRWLNIYEHNKKEWRVKYIDM